MVNKYTVAAGSMFEFVIAEQNMQTSSMFDLL